MKYLFLLLLVLPNLSLAQPATNPEQVADEAVRNWLETPRPDLTALPRLSTEEACTLLPELLQSPPPPEGTDVNFGERRELETDDPTLRRYSYPAALPGGRLELVEVILQSTGQSDATPNEVAWEVQRVGVEVASAADGRAWLQTPPAYWLFVAFSLYVVFLLVRPSFFRRWLAEGWGVIRSYRRTVVGTLVTFSALFGLGALTGASLPAVCGEAILSVLNAAITSVGAVDAYGSLNVARAAVVTFYQNFVVVTLSLLFGSGLLFGVPAYLVGAFAFYTQGIPFGLVGSLSAGQFLFLVILLVLELTSYFLVIAGGGILLVSVIREGFSGFSKGVRRLALMLPFALILLLVGAWYESSLIILPQLFGGP